ncbi:MAG: sensor domain-containing diguanylate cyclase [Clostridia bacterium]|nr:sensor domain-containing diguanylate cyclase [Clostridia bacterium]
MIQEGKKVNFQQVVDGIGAMTCVVSVQKRADGGYGDIRIVTGNMAYIDSIEHPMGGVQMLKSRFTPNSLYTDYMTRDLNFEDFCYRSAVEKKCLHSYAHPDRFDVWFNMTFLPLTPDDGDLCFCTYTMEINLSADSSRMSNVSSELASSVLETAIKLRGATDFEATMADVIKDIREICLAKQCCILLMEPVSRTCSVLCEDIAEGSLKRPMAEIIDDSFYDLAESWESVISGSNCLIAKNEQDMEVVRQRNPEWYKSLAENDVHSIVLFPLKSRNERHGYIWATDFEPGDAPKIKEALELATFILGSEIGNHLLLKRLQILSSRDMLTGIMNRNEMNNCVDALSDGRQSPGRPVGVLFADLNGLKRVNDSLGHTAGDELIRAATRVLRRVFHDGEIFRAGGDEFTVISVDATLEEMERKVRQIAKYEKDEDRVSFAVGYCVEADCRNVRNALRTADERMYENKREYYRTHPKSERAENTPKP